MNANIANRPRPENLSTQVRNLNCDHGNGLFTPAVGLEPYLPCIGDAFRYHLAWCISDGLSGDTGSENLGASSHTSSSALVTEHEQGQCNCWGRAILDLMRTCNSGISTRHSLR